MSRHDPLLALQHMLDHAVEAAEMAGGRERIDLDTDRQFALAMVRLMEITGEASRRVPESIRQRNPQVPWRDIAALRNRLIHGYDTVNHDILWDVIQLDLPPLIEQLRSILADSDDNSA